MPQDARPARERAVDGPSPWTVPGSAHAAADRIEASGLPPRPPRAAGSAGPVNVPAAVSLLLVVFFPPAAAVLGVVALWQIRRSGERGWGMALTGLTMGIALTLLYACVVVFLIAMSSWPGPGG